MANRCTHVFNSDLICSECGSITIISRNVENKKPINILYCPKCKKITQQIGSIESSYINHIERELKYVRQHFGYDKGNNKYEDKDRIPEKVL